MTQSAAGGRTTARAGLGCGTGSRGVAVAGGGDGGGIGERTVGSRLPRPGIGTCGCTGGCLGGGSRIVGGGQLGQAHRGGAGAAGTGALDGAGGRGGGAHILGIAVVMTQSAAGGDTAAGTLLGHGTGSRSVVVPQCRGGGSAADGAGSRSGTGSRGAAGVAAGGPVTDVAIPGVLIHRVNAAGRAGNRQVAGLVPLVIPAIGGIAAVHTAENHVAVSGGNRGGVIVVALGCHTDPFIVSG